MAVERPIGLTGGPPGGGDARNEYGLTADQAAQNVSHGYEFFQLGRQKGNEGKPMSVNGALNTFVRYANGTPQQRAQFAQIQNYLFLGGFYSSKNYVPTYGAYRLEDLAAMKKALLSASAGKGPGKIALGDFFTQMAALYQMGNARAPRARGPVLTVQYTDPTDIRRVIERTAPDVIGRDLSDDEKGRLIDAYHELEAGAQRKAFSAQTGGGGSYTAPPDLSSFAAEQTKQLHPQEAHTYGELGGYNVLLSMIGGSSAIGGAGG